MRKELSDEVKAKLRKILALAESGIDGEQLAAKNKLQKLLLEHNLTLEDLADDGEENVYVFHKISNKIEQKLWAHVCFKVKDVHNIEFYSSGKTKRVFTCTEAQANEIAELYKWHKSNFKKELSKVTEELLTAYLMKHKLHSETPIEKDDSDSNKPVDLARLMRIMAYQSGMSDRSYYKSLNA